MNSLKQLQSLHTKLLILYLLLIIIPIQIIPFYFTNTLQNQLLHNFNNNITQYPNQLHL
ncbi:hypothetical protein, partial [Staphylococcus epidermidis]|uniref:hypothetical protein n=1 Tax=Staphylococcus epidermidis TaxID=1282 RepID=UPI0021B1CF4B